ncbi:glycosyltransferase family 2 protein [Paenibacillus sp. NPDC057886]|uniref:glycosyltransferase family 2 protein n=1 Tax=Paenibacillus sp. NPDC057886 TaxID=3346270 RepID=UPI0036B6442A
MQTSGVAMNASIILYARNAHLLQYCVKSIQLHTPYPYELIVINELDDETVLEPFQGMPEFRSLTWPTGLHTEEAFQIGASVASGDILVLMHDYVAVTSHWLNDLVGILEHDTKLSIVSPIITDVDITHPLDQANLQLDSLYKLARGRRAVQSHGVQWVDELEGPLLVVKKRPFIERSHRKSASPGHQGEACCLSCE